jgi:hypothetical protein
MSTINPHDALDDRARTTVDNWPVVTIVWHEPTAPKRVHDAYAALREGLDVVSRLREEFRELRTADERQERERREAHAAQWEDKLLALQAAQNRARELRAQYDAMETDPAVMAEERDALVKALEGEHARMAELAVEAERAYQRFAAVRARAEYLSLELGDVEAPAGLKYANDDVTDGSEWGAILRVAQSTDPRVTGEWLVSALRDATSKA